MSGARLQCDLASPDAWARAAAAIESAGRAVSGARVGRRPLDRLDVASSGSDATRRHGDPAAALRGADVAIDFTLPQATAANLAACVAAKRPLVIGTTGHDEGAARPDRRGRA